MNVLVSDQLFPAAPQSVEGARPVLPPPPTLPHLPWDWGIQWISSGMRLSRDFLSSLQAELSKEELLL